MGDDPAEKEPTEPQEPTEKKAPEAPVIKTASDENNSADGAQNSDDTQKPKIKVLERCRKWIGSWRSEWLLVIVTGILAWTGAIQAFASIKAANAAIRAAQIAQSALHEQRAEVIVEERPYVSLEPIRITPNRENFPSSNYIFAVNIFATNYGRTPAFKELTVNEKILTGKDVDKQIEAFFKDADSRKKDYTGIVGATIPTTDDAANHFNAFTTAFSDTVSEADWKDDFRSSTQLAVVARAYYKDFAGNVYVTELCEYRQSNGIYHDCDAHNGEK